MYGERWQRCTCQSAAIKKFCICFTTFIAISYNLYTIIILIFTYETLLDVWEVSSTLTL